MVTLGVYTPKVYISIYVIYPPYHTYQLILSTYNPYGFYGRWALGGLVVKLGLPTQDG